MTPQASHDLVRQGFSSRVVPPTNAIKGQPLVLAEAPGRREDEEGVTLHPEADAGGLFTRLLKRVGVSRDDLTLCNTVWQRPPRNELYDDNGYPMPYTSDAIAYWKPFLHEFINQMQPPVIIGLGRTALDVLTGFSDIGTTRGYVHSARIEIENDSDDWDKMWDKYDLHIPCICTYHPQFLNYGQKHLSGVFLRDVLAGLEIGRDGWKPPKLVTNPTPSVDEFKWFCQQFNPSRHVLTYDIENPETRGRDEDEIEAEFGKKEISYEIDRMSFCFDTLVGGWSVPFREPYVGMAKSLVTSASVVRGHNCRLHDRPRLLSHGFVFNAQEQDTLDLWRHLHRTLPASVAYVAPFYLSISPWKHTAHTQPESYSALDAVVQHHIGEGIERDLRASGQWETAQRHVVEVLALCEQMGRNGLPYDKERAKAFEKELEEKLETRLARLNELVPESVKPVKQKSGLKRVPKDLTGYVQREFTVTMADVAKSEIVLRQDVNKSVVLRYALLEPFNANSHVQKKALIRHFGHKLKTNRKSKKETSDDNTLKSLITSYIESEKPQDKTAVECYQLIRECVAISKVLGTYVRGWRPGSDGLIHATPGIWGDMFRISWRDPNLAATVADKKEVQIASGFRKCIACASDEVIIESDWRSQEAVLLAYFAQDSDYMRLAKMSLNAYMCSHLLNRPADLSWSDATLREYLRDIRSDPANTKLYDDAKHCIAEGELVLTDSGLIPIQNITIDNKVWDGVEWVSHSGIVDQGVREVITYDGLTATSDHQVFTQDGRRTTLGLASDELARLHSTGYGRQAIRSAYRDLIEGSARERLHTASCAVHKVRSKEVGGQKQSQEHRVGTAQGIDRLSDVYKAEVTVSTGVGLALQQHHEALQRSDESGLQALRRSRNQMPVHVLQALPRVDAGESTASDLSRDHAGSYRQRWSLCSGEPAVGVASRAIAEQAYDRLVHIPRQTDSPVRFRQSLRHVMDFPAGREGADRRTDHREREGARPSGQSKELDVPTKVARRSRVYDILNAGPRRCFTVSGKLVCNCIYLVQNGGTYFLLSEMYEVTKARAKYLIDFYYDLFPRIKAFQQKTLQTAHETCRLVNAWGYRLPVWEAFKWNQKRFDTLRKLWVRFRTDATVVLTKKERHLLARIEAQMGLGEDEAIRSVCYDLGDEAKAALSFLPRDTGSAMLKEALLAMENEHQLVSRGVLRATAHDSLLAICKRKEADEIGTVIRNIMQRPQKPLDGLVIEVEQSIGQSWDKKTLRPFRPSALYEATYA